VPSIHHKDVEQAVVVVIEESNTAGHRFDEVFEGSGRVSKDEINTR
jgi:hypothetical protein